MTTTFRLGCIAFLLIFPLGCGTQSQCCPLLRCLTSANTPAADAEPSAAEPKTSAPTIKTYPVAFQSEDAPAETPSLKIESGRRIAFVGNSLAERMNLYGHFETLLHLRFAKEELKVRNFGWPADEVGIQQRPNNYTKLDNPLDVFAPDTFLCFFGFNESFAGKDGVPYFRQRYQRYLDDLTARFSQNGTAPQFVLVSPIAFERSENPFQPTGETENANLELYTKAIQELAHDRNVPFVDLFHPTKDAFAKEPGLQYTINGVHLNEAGDELMAGLLDRSLFHSDPPGAPGSGDYDKLQAAVKDKSWVHLNDYRMLNGWYVYGGRRTYDTETFPLEYKKIRKMAAVRDRYVWDIAQGKQVAEKPDDSNTGKLIVPPTGVGRHFPARSPRN